MHQKTKDLIQKAYDILNEIHPMTLRQVYYQLVAKQVIENNLNSYQSLSKKLVDARQQGLIPWDWMEDRTREPRRVSMWENLSDFADSVKYSYKKDTWLNQSMYFEIWLEKEALAEIFEDITREYGITLVV